MINANIISVLMSGGSGGGSSTWILSDGTWNDLKAWDDTATWID